TTPPGPAGPHGAAPPNAAPPGGPSPLPAGINLIVPVGTLLGFSADPAQAGSWGLLDRDETRAVVGAAARHPRTRWCVTLTAPDGTALAHGCARGRHPRLLDDLAPQPPPDQLTELLRRLNLTFTPVARGSCDHAQSEERYVPSRALQHLVRARSASCDAPGCPAPAVSADLDHTTPYPDGPTDQCNLAPRCRTHHRAKQAPDWKVEQVQPGVTRWTLPSGRVHLTTPTRYGS
ncbi:MAG TPA: HNH endonuclease signature motif containing protein, partial [Trebonia sp.]